MLLRESSKAIDVEVEAKATMGGDGAETVKHGAVLVAFAEAVTKGSEIDQARAEVLNRLGHAGFIEAACIVGIFNGLVRTADATGIPLDDSMKKATIGDREELGINAFHGAKNTL